MAALKCAYVGLLVLLCSSFSFAHRFFLDNDDQMPEGERHVSTDDPGTGTGIGKDFGFGSGGGSSGVGVGLGYGVGYGAGRNGYEDPGTGGSGWGIGVGSDGSVSGTGGAGFIPGLPGFGVGGSIRWPGFDFGGSIGLPGLEIGGGIGAGQGSGGAAGTRSPSYGIGRGQGGSSGGTIAGIGMPPPHFIPGYGQIGNGCTCSPECYNQVSTTKGGSASKANDEEHNIGAQDEVSRDEAHESIDVAMEPWSPHETHESNVATTEPYSP
ncbi:hypothetical protein NC651_004018 [Populus alba x Populus x berolinensis]|nr:hypothetical protein NC651_004018 [Populus alba x Populus x berolinensis]